MDRVAAMQTFVRVVESGSFVRAAEQLGLSTTAASRQISELEAHLGGRLLNRTTRSLSLTDAGRAYFERCLLLLPEFEEAEALVGQQSILPSGLLRLTAPISFGAQRMASLLAGFRERYPKVEVDISLSDRWVDLVEEGFDLALRISANLDPSLVARRLCTVQILCCAAPAYLSRAGEPRLLQDLSRHNCLIYTNSPRSEEWVFQGAGNGLESVTVKGSWRANSGDILRIAALAGEGITCQPSFLVGEDIRKGRLVRVLCNYRLSDLAMYAVYPSRRHLSAKVRVLVDYLAGELADPPPWDAWMQESDGSATPHETVLPPCLENGYGHGIG